MEYQACAKLQVVLMVIHAVVEMSEVVIRLERPQRKSTSQLVVHSAADLCGKCVSAGAHSSQGSPGVSTPQEHLRKRRELRVVMPMISRAKQVRGERQIRSRAGNVARMDGADFSDGGESRIEMNGEGSVSAIQREARAASRRRIAANVVVVSPDFKSRN